MSLSTLSEIYRSYIGNVCKQVGNQDMAGTLVKGFDAFMESESGNAKRKMINKIYNAARPMLDGLKRDDNWESVRNIINAIHEQVPEFEFNVTVPDGGYYNNGDDGMPRAKRYVISGTTPEGYQIYGQLTCSAAGTMEDPFSSYDITLSLS